MVRHHRLIDGGRATGKLQFIETFAANRPFAFKFALK
jgi:hypothetical protein